MKHLSEVKWNKIKIREVFLRKIRYKDLEVFIKTNKNLGMFITDNWTSNWDTCHSFLFSYFAVSYFDSSFSDEKLYRLSKSTQRLFKEE